MTGLEPGTDYPNAKSFERDKGRVVKMAAGETYGATLVVEVQDSVRGVDAVEEEIDAIQESGQRVVHGEPISEYSEV